MKKLLFFLLVAALCIPQQGEAQYLSWDNLKIHAGASFPWMQHDGFNLYGVDNMKMFTLRPHVQIAYNLSVASNFDVVLFSGYNPLGAKDQVSNNSYRKTTSFRLNTLALGVKALYQFYSFQIGPMFSWNYVVSTDYKREYKTDGTWKTNVENSHLKNLVDKKIFQLGFSLQKKVGNHWSVNIEGSYGLNDIFIHEDQWTADVMFGNIKWYPRQYRLSIGYSF